MAPAETAKTLLLDHSFVAGMSSEHLEALVPVTRVVSFQANDRVFRAGTPADQCYLLSRGSVAVEIFEPRLGPLVLQTLSAPDVLGWSWMVRPYLWCFDARATEDATALALDAAQLRAACDSNPALGYELLKRFTEVFAQRLNAARLQLMDFYGMPQPPVTPRMAADRRS
jgi:CRP/FNR family transcriptional regulator, cyclic AMP receptor protein